MSLYKLHQTQIVADQSVYHNTACTKAKFNTDSFKIDVDTLCSIFQGFTTKTCSGFNFRELNFDSGHTGPFPAAQTFANTQKLTSLGVPATQQVIRKMPE
jgi:hypothetical protein